jgi:quinol-cytochrome oxidoreductase complex cytochrome b subunit
MTVKVALETSWLGPWDNRKTTQSIYRNPKAASAVWLPIVEK